MSATPTFGTVFRPKLKWQRARQWSEIKLLEEIEPWVVDCMLKISEFTQLPQNWDSHGSSPVTPQALKTALTFLSESPVHLIAEPSVSPVPGGGLGFHWKVDGRDLEVPIDDALPPSR